MGCERAHGKQIYGSFAGEWQFFKAEQVCGLSNRFLKLTHCCRSPSREALLSIKLEQGKITSTEYEQLAAAEKRVGAYLQSIRCKLTFLCLSSSKGDSATGGAGC
jgi:hypothetical protein